MAKIKTKISHQYLSVTTVLYFSLVWIIGGKVAFKYSNLLITLWELKRLNFPAYPTQGILFEILVISQEVGKTLQNINSKTNKQKNLRSWDVAAGILAGAGQSFLMIDAHRSTEVQHCPTGRCLCQYSELSVRSSWVWGFWVEPQFSRESEIVMSQCHSWLLTEGSLNSLWRKEFPI